VTHRGPVVTALVVVAGLVGFMTANSAGALVEANPDEKGVEVPAPPGQAQGSQAKPGEKAPESPKEPPKEEEKPAPDKPDDQQDAPTFPAEAAYAGDATGSDIAVAVAVKGDQASAYLCDGAAVEDWLKGSAENGQLELTSKDGASSLTAKLEGDRLVGEINVDGETLPFSIGVADSPAGLYRGENGETTVGWIIMPNGQQVGIANTAGEEAAAPELDPERGYVTIDGQRVDAEEITGESTWN
jgi:hypothetical protein